VTIMANYVPFWFRKRTPGTGAVWAAGIRQDRLCAMSLQVRAVIAGDGPCRAGAKPAVRRTAASQRPG